MLEAHIQTRNSLNTLCPLDRGPDFQVSLPFPFKKGMGIDLD
jgi:hypothetical protein